MAVLVGVSMFSSDEAQEKKEEIEEIGTFRGRRAGDDELKMSTMFFGSSGRWLRTILTLAWRRFAGDGGAHAT
jgi:hypothetical protein